MEAAYRPVGRRAFLGLLGAGALGVVVGSPVQTAIERAFEPLARADGTGLTDLLPTTAKFRYYTAAGFNPDISRADYRLVVTGAVDDPLDLGFDDLLERPLHPYSAGLTRALPGSVPVGSPLASIPGVVPTIDDDTTGCYFADRCEFTETRCREQTPVLETVQVDGVFRRVRCHRWAELELQGVTTDE